MLATLLQFSPRLSEREESYLLTDTEQEERKREETVRKLERKQRSLISFLSRKTHS
jgi:hypothetical protein